MDKVDAVAVNLRIDDRLRQQLLVAAKRSVRSLNGEIIFRLRRSLGSENTEASARTGAGVNNGDVFF
jgi:hypothetical protein